ncbi:unnamed protein product [Penicillium camemberti]|uniref:Str. FM013 n=1 Tax=Penicillium camemberti (strain FM 013) TaxID=1429867 RepID=A0A0G4PLA4_PENC3|nr:unnamed protein product [Penicillium camemberti]
MSMCIPLKRSSNPQSIEAITTLNTITITITSIPIPHLPPKKQSPINPHSPIPNLLAIVVSLQFRSRENRSLVGMVISGHLDRDAQGVIMMFGMDGDGGGAGSNVSCDCAHEGLVVGVGVPCLDEDVHPVADLAWIVLGFRD